MTSPAVCLSVCPSVCTGFLLALGLDPNLNPYHQTLTTFTTLEGDAPASTLVAARPATPYEVGHHHTACTHHPFTCLFPPSCLRLVRLGQQQRCTMLLDTTKAAVPFK